jgi:multicomponent Na+:H+ antiporter subunit C
MNLLMSFLVAVLFTIGIFLILQKDLMRIIIGIFILSNAANLVLFTSAGFQYRAFPFIREGEEFLSTSVADPLPQALILTAIVIGLGVFAFFLVLSRVLYKEIQSEKVSELKASEE